MSKQGLGNALVISSVIWGCVWLTVAGHGDAAGALATLALAAAFLL